MYSEIVNGLGLSQNTLELMVLIALGIFICGVILVLFWKHIIVGALALSCLVVMANHKPTIKTPPVEPVKEEVQATPIIQAPKLQTPEKPVELSEPKDIRKEFMDKCINLADYTRTQCDELWDDRVKEERTLLEDTKLKGDKHGSYHKV
jgi:hypothetical protein